MVVTFGTSVFTVRMARDKKTDEHYKLQNGGYDLEKITATVRKGNEMTEAEKAQEDEWAILKTIEELLNETRNENRANKRPAETDQAGNSPMAASSSSK